MRRAWCLTASLFFAIPLAGGWSGSQPTATGAAVLALIAAATVLKPSWGLLAMCGVLPLATPLSIATGSPSLFEELILAFLVSACLRLAIEREAPPSTLVRPAVLLGMVIVVSGTLTISLVQQRAYASVEPFLAAAWTQFSAHYYDPTPYGGVMVRLMNWLEALALAVVSERLIRRDPASRLAAVRLLIVAGGALALFSTNHLIEIALVSPDALHAFATSLLRSRFNPFYRDVNAAASILALFLAPALWLTWRERRWWAAVAAVSLSLALWLASSRAAFAAVVAVVGAAWARTARPARHTVLISALVAAMAVIAISVTSSRNASFVAAASVRLELYRIAARLTIANPVFGTGLDTFRERSAPEILPDLRARYQYFFATGENAHNNFLQILAELGVMGFGAFVWMLAPAVRGAWRTTSPQAGDARAPALALGVSAFLMTCFLGHPLLLDDVRWQFFFVLGVATALVTPPAHGSRYGRALFAAATLFVAAAAPMRLLAARETADLSGVVIGTSEARDSDDGVQYRLVWTDATWYVSPSARAVTLRVRADDVSEEPCGATLSIDHRLADAPSPGRDTWTPLVYQLQSTRGGAFHRLDLHVTGPQCRVMVSGVAEVP